MKSENTQGIPAEGTEQQSCRRHFLKSLGLGVGAAAVAGTAGTAALMGTRALAADKKAATTSAAGAAGAGAGGALELVKEDDPLPKGLGYMHDATKATRTDKAGVKGTDQHCQNCQFYSKAGELNKEEVGKCQLFPKGVVKSKGWCKSWIKKPG